MTDEGTETAFFHFNWPRPLPWSSQWKLNTWKGLNSVSDPLIQTLFRIRVDGSPFQLDNKTIEPNKGWKKAFHSRWVKPRPDESDTHPRLWIIGNAEAFPILCVRYIRWERQREREIQREKDGSDVTIVALKLAMSFALLLAKNVHLSIGDEFCAFPCQKNLHLSFSPLDWRWIHTFRCQKRCTFRNGSHSSHCQMAWWTGDRNSKANDRISGCTVLLSRRKNRKNESNYYQKLLEI